MTGVLRVRPLLQMLDDWIRENESGSATSQVLPCLTNDLAGDIDLIASTVHSAGGALLNTTKIRAAFERPADLDDYRGPTPGNASSLIATTVQAAVRVRRAGADLGVRLKVSRGKLDAEYTITGGSSLVALPSGDDPLLAVIRALCSDRFGHEAGKLAVVVYNQSEFDGDQARMAWELAGHLRSLPGGPRTVVMLVAAEINLRLHVGYENGFRYAHVDGAVVRRHSPDRCKATVANIRRSPAPFVGMFLGAGFSASSGLALGNDLRDRAIRALNISEPAADSSQLAADWYRYIEELGGLLPSEEPLTPDQRIAALTLERVLRQEYATFSPAHPPTLSEFKLECDAALGKLGGAPRELARLVASGRQKFVVCTVNFDELIESAGPDLFRVFATEADFAKAPQHLDDYLNGKDPLVPLWKLHGTISDLSSCVASDDQTLLGLPSNKRTAFQKLIELSYKSNPSPWLYIGASMRDTDLGPVWALPEFAEIVNEHWVLPFATESVTNFVHSSRAEGWSQRRTLNFDQRLVSETADTFIKALADAFTVSGHPPTSP